MHRRPYLGVGLHWLWPMLPSLNGGTEGAFE